MSAARAIAPVLVAALVGVSAARVAALSNQEERDLGRRFAMMARQQLPLASDPDVDDLVASIGNKIVAHLDSAAFEYHFTVVRDPSINAFAVPGGYIFVHDGLLVNAANEDEVAAVLAHEVAHVHAHHMARQQEKTQLLNYASMLAMLAAVLRPEVAALASAATQAKQLEYSREFEQEADLLGARYMREAGYDPRAMLDFFKKLEDQSRMQPTMVPPYLQTHPLDAERLNQIEAVLHTQQWSDHPRTAASFNLVRAQALSRAHAGPVRDVMEQYRRALAQDPEDGLRNYLYGLVALETGSLGDAAVPLEKARSAGIEPADRELGRLALRRRDVPGAVSHLQAYLARSPEDATAALDLGSALEASGDLAAARASYLRSLKIDPELAAAQHAYGVLSGRAGDEGEGYYHLATAARLNGDYEKALEQFERAQSLLPAGDANRGSTAREIEELKQYLKETGGSRR